MNKIIRIAPLLIVGMLLIACSLLPQNVTFTSPTAVNVPAISATISPQDDHTLRGAAQHTPYHPISIGTAANIDAFHKDATYKKLLGQEFNMLTAENVMKMYVTHPNIDTFDYSQGDELVAFAQQQHMEVEGSNLIWSNQVPSWIMQGGYTRDELLGIMKDYITNVVSHYKNQVSAWVVVNEPLDTDEANRTSIWERIIGPDYMDYAFRWAHQADPQAKLYLNEFDVETPGQKTDQYYALAQRLLKRGVPLNGIGFEDHMDITHSYPPAQMTATMQRFARLGVQVQITEADVQLQNSHASTQEKLKRQAQIYTSLVHSCQAVSQCNAMTIWGFTDRYTWIPAYTHHADQPLIFDAQYRPKPAYNAIRDAFLHKQ